MNYERIYSEFISNRKKKEKYLTGYFESHHIVPRSLGGSDEKENIIKLTASDHYFSHIILGKIYGGPMVFALFFMSEIKCRSAYGYDPGRHRYERAKLKMSAAAKIRSTGEGNSFYGKSHSEETKKRISKKKTGKMTGKDHPSFGKPSPLRGIPIKESTRTKLSRQRMGSNNPMFGKTMEKSTNYNATVFPFYNKKTGESFIGTQRELINKYSLEFRNVSAFIKGKRKSCNGWMLSGAKK